MMKGVVIIAVKGDGFEDTSCRAFVDSVVFLVTPCEFPIFLNIGHMRQGRLLSDGGPRCHRNTHRIGGSRQ